MLDNKVFTYCKVSSFEEESNHNRSVGNVFIHNAARSRLSPQMAEPCKERIDTLCTNVTQHKLMRLFEGDIKSDILNLT